MILLTWFRDGEGLTVNRLWTGLPLAGSLYLASLTASGGEPIWVDLTHPLSEHSIFWPTAEPFRLTTDAEGMTDAGYYYSAYSFSAAEHGGTHIDAPIHFAEGRMTVDQIPLSRLIGDAVVIDVTDKALDDPDYLISTADIATWEARHGRLPAGAIVLFHTGYSRFWPDALKYLGTAERGQAGAAALHFPGLNRETATWLVQERKVGAVGIDTASIDAGQSKNFAAHVALMSANVPAFENLSGLDQLPPTGAFVVALPIKIEGGSGGPLRIVARMPEG
jgi:kynurenine formamidase